MREKVDQRHEKRKPTRKEIHFPSTSSPNILVHRDIMPWLNRKALPCPHQNTTFQVTANPEQILKTYGPVCPTCSYDRGLVAQRLGKISTDREERKALESENNMTIFRKAFIKERRNFMENFPATRTRNKTHEESVCPCCYGRKCFCPHHAPGMDTAVLEYMVCIT